MLPTIWAAKKILSSRLSKTAISVILHLYTLYWLNLSVVISVSKERKKLKWEDMLSPEPQTRFLTWLNFHVRVIITNPCKHVDGHWVLESEKESKMRKGKIKRKDDSWDLKKFIQNKNNYYFWLNSPRPIIRTK